MPRILPIEHTHIDLNDIPGASSMSQLFQVMGHRPELAQHTLALLEATMRGGTVEPQLKELLAIRVSQVNHCVY